MKYIALAVSLLVISQSAFATEQPATFVIENHVVIDADIEEVFEFAGDPLNDPQWRAEVNEMSASGPWEVGTVYDEDSCLGFNPHYITPTIMRELDPPYLMVVETPEDNLYLKSTRTFEETDDGGTVMVYRLEVDERMPADVLGLALPQALVKFYYNNVMRAYLRKLKRILE